MKKPPPSRKQRSPSPEPEEEAPLSEEEKQMRLVCDCRVCSVFFPNFQCRFKIGIPRECCQIAVLSRKKVIPYRVVVAILFR